MGKTLSKEAHEAASEQTLKKLELMRGVIYKVAASRVKDNGADFGIDCSGRD